ncbi:MAG: hypothetical protein Q4P15_07735 [Propionibacteriaceae bacterium]|nr:hypothetical protein [Propionibacteriaceae bacterium]
MGRSISDPYDWKVAADVIPFLLLPIGVAFFIGVAVSTARKDRQRSDVWAMWAAARGWGYATTWPQMIRGHSGGPFNKGGGRRADRAFWGTFDKVPMFGFRYRYTVSTGKSSQTFPFLMVGIRFPGAVFPPMSLTYERDFLFCRDKDLQFENQQFNQTWRVKSHSARFAHDVLHPRTMDFLMRQPLKFKELWFSGDVLFVCVAGDPDPDAADALMRLLSDFMDLLPSHLLREVGATDRKVDDSGPGVPIAEQRRRIAIVGERSQSRARRPR